jgi:hypothetical protein
MPCEDRQRLRRKPNGGLGQEHLGAADHLPTRGVMLAALDFVEDEPVEVRQEIEVVTELQRRVLADGWCGARKGLSSRWGMGVSFESPYSIQRPWFTPPMYNRESAYRGVAGKNPSCLRYSQ